VATQSLKGGTLWRTDFRGKRDFHLKIWALSPFCDFSPKKKVIPHAITIFRTTMVIGICNESKEDDESR
jgi:hypothetical protein